MFRMLVHPFSGACDLLWIYFVLYCSVRIEVLALAHTHDIRIYSGNIIKNTLHTRELKEPQDTAATNIYRNTLIKTITHVTTNHSLLNKDANAKNSILTEQYNT